MLNMMFVGDGVLLDKLVVSGGMVSGLSMLKVMNVGGVGV